MAEYNDPVSQVRLLVGDLETGENQIFDDTQLGGYLAITNGNIKRAAADALDTIASSEALLSKKITTQDRSTDGPAVADALRKHAAALRKRADDEDAAAEDDPFFLAFNLTGSDRQEGEEARL